MHNYTNAFLQILNKSLCIKNTDDLSVIFDESGQEYLRYLIKAVEELDVSCTFLYLPYDLQLHLIKNHDTSQEIENKVEDSVKLPKALKTSIQESNAVINIINASQETTRIRTTLLTARKHSECKFAHIPGISREILEVISKTPFDEIKKEAEWVAWAIGQTSNAELHTFDKDGRKHILKMNFEGWDNEPLISSGIIERGNWGNVPPGETFCCPEAKFVEGKIVINGSLPRIPFNRGEEVILEFNQGKLTNYSSEQKNILEFFDNLRSASESKGDYNWKVFAELGVGLNPAITSLTGNSLFDEKMAGTIHVAIGNNVIFGHTIYSINHVDMVALNPILVLNNRVIISNGTIDIQKIKEWKADDTQRFNLDDQVKEFSIDYTKIEIDQSHIYRVVTRGGRRSLIRILRIIPKPWSKTLVSNLRTQSPTYFRKDELLNSLCKNDTEKSEVNNFLGCLANYGIIVPEG